MVECLHNEETNIHFLWSSLDDSTISTFFSRILGAQSNAKMSMTSYWSIFERFLLSKQMCEGRTKCNFMFIHSQWTTTLWPFHFTATNKLCIHFAVFYFVENNSGIIYDQEIKNWNTNTNIFFTLFSISLSLTYFLNTYRFYTTFIFKDS